MFYRNVLNNIRQDRYYDSIVIEGCSGCGKSTLMSLLETQGYNAYHEPVSDNFILDKYFSDRQKYSFPLQVFFLNRRFEHIQKVAMTSRTTLLDRSIYGDVIFAKMAQEQNEMTDEEFQVYLELYKNLLHNIHPPKLMIYLESSIDGILDRIKRRGRDYEQNAEKEYWEALLRNYNDYFEQYNLSPVIRINVDKYNFADNKQDQSYVMDLIMNEIKRIDKQ